jgi:hypothetical protein
LLKLAGELETVKDFRQIDAGAVLDDDDSARSDQVGFIEKFKGADVVVFFIVRRIEKNKIGHQMASGKFLQAADGVGFDYFGGGKHLQRFEILLDELYGGCVGLDEDDLFCAAANRFDADGAGAGEKIDEERVVHRGAEDVEQGFAQTIAGGADFEIARSFQKTAAIFACDDAHDMTFRNVYPTDASW